MCARCRPALPTTKDSLRNVNQAFGDELKIDYGYFEIVGVKHVVLIMVDVGTAYGEEEVVKTRNMDDAWEEIERVWICNHWQRRAVSGGDEFNNAQFMERMTSRDISFHARPARLSNKIGIVEQNHSTVKRILERLVTDSTHSSPALLVMHTFFFSSMISGSHILSSFEQERGYKPAVLSSVLQYVTRGLFNAHVEQSATRALQDTLQVRSSNRLITRRPIPGTPVLHFYKSSKHNEKYDWCEGTV